MNLITEKEFENICQGIRNDREMIIKHNPLGSDDEILLWMLLSCLISFLSLSEIETPCFNGTPTTDVYRQAINHIIERAQTDKFDIDAHLDTMLIK